MKNWSLKVALLVLILNSSFIPHSKSQSTAASSRNVCFWVGSGLEFNSHDLQNRVNLGITGSVMYKNKHTLTVRQSLFTGMLRESNTPADYEFAEYSRTMFTYGYTFGRTSFSEFSIHTGVSLNSFNYRGEVTSIDLIGGTTGMVEVYRYAYSEMDFIGVPVVLKANTSTRFFGFEGLVYANFGKYTEVGLGIGFNLGMMK